MRSNIPITGTTTEFYITDNSCPYEPDIKCTELECHWDRFCGYNCNPPHYIQQNDTFSFNIQPGPLKRKLLNC